MATGEEDADTLRAKPSSIKWYRIRAAGAWHRMRLKKEAEEDLALQKNEGGELFPPSSTGTGQASQVHEKLSTIIELLNERFGLEIPADAQPFVDGLTDALVQDEQVQQSAKVNDRTNFGLDLDPRIRTRLINHHSSNTDFVDQVMGNDEVWKAFGQMMVDQVYAALEGRAAP